MSRVITLTQCAQARRGLEAPHCGEVDHRSGYGNTSVTVCQTVTERKACHLSGVMRWRFEQEVVQASLLLVSLRRTPGHYKYQVVSLVTLMSFFFKWLRSFRAVKTF